MLWEADHTSQRFTSLTGFPIEESERSAKEWFSAGFWAERVHPADLQFVVDFCTAAIEDQQDHRFECRVIRSSGAVVWIENSVTVVVEDGKTVGMKGSIVDITERKLAQQQQASAQTMDAVGRLAGNVAHDFNNLLTVIKTYGELIELNLPEAGPATNYVRAIRNAADRAADLTAQLLLFNTQSLGSTSSVDVNDALRSIEDMLQASLQESITLRMNLDTSVGMAQADRSRLEQAVFNMVQNSNEAIETTGAITIGSRLITVQAADESTHPDDEPNLIPGSYVEISVADDGRGVDSENLNRVFEPFFTTKAFGGGRGVGLTVVYGIAQQHDGHASITSEPGDGTTVRVLLPAAVVPETTTPTQIKHTDMPRGTETILLVEDEEDIRRVGQVALSRLGYTVLSAAEPIEALELAKSATESIDLIVTDVVMPNMFGHELVAKLMPMMPDVHVLFTSGYTATTLRTELQGGRFLPKPFSLEDLARSVRQAIDEPPTSET